MGKEPTILAPKNSENLIYITVTVVSVLQVKLLKEGKDPVSEDSPKDGETPSPTDASNQPPTDNSIALQEKVRKF